MQERSPGEATGGRGAAGVQWVWSRGGAQWAQGERERGAGQGRIRESTAATEMSRASAWGLVLPPGRGGWWLLSECPGGEFLHPGEQKERQSRRITAGGRSRQVGQLS